MDAGAGMSPRGWQEALDLWDSVLASVPAAEPGSPRWAVVDCGTNTFNLLIRDRATGATVLSTKLPVKLGQGGLTDGRLAPDAMERGIHALKLFREGARALGVESLWAFATSGVRSTENGAEFADRAERLTGVPLNVIDGLQEAAFIFAGVQQAYPLPHEPVLVMDIGGGSTEFIVGSPDSVVWALSLPLGVTRLRERFQPSDPVQPAEWNALQQYVHEELQPVFEAIDRYRPVQLIGSSGSFDTLYDLWALAQGMPGLQPGQLWAQWPAGALKSLFPTLIRSSTAQRLEMPGMIPMRADTLHLSPLQIEPVLQKLPGGTPVGLSTFALKEGVWSALIQNPTAWRASSW